MHLSLDIFPNGAGLSLRHQRPTPTCRVEDGFAGFPSRPNHCTRHMSLESRPTYKDNHVFLYSCQTSTFLTLTARAHEQPLFVSYERSHPLDMATQENPPTDLLPTPQVAINFVPAKAGEIIKLGASTIRIMEDGSHTGKQD